MWLRAFVLGYFIERDLGTIYKYYSLDSSLKILSCDFFLMDGSVFFKLSIHMAKS